MPSDTRCDRRPKIEVVPGDDWCASGILLGLEHPQRTDATQQSLLELKISRRSICFVDRRSSPIVAWARQLLSYGLD